jgi:hypothetical protein
MNDVQKLLAYVNKNLGDQLNSLELPREYYYHSITLAAIDAIYSIQSRYQSVENVIERYCAKYKLLPAYKSPDNRKNQQKVSVLVSEISDKTVEYFAEEIFQNRTRTAGRLKASILLDLLTSLQNLKIETFECIQVWLRDLEKQQSLINYISYIQGIGVATSRYFLMLCGDDQMVKPDTMILRFIENALNRRVAPLEAVYLIQSVSKILKISPRLLDYNIWFWQRNQYITVINQSKKAVTKQLSNKNNSHLTIPQKTQASMHKRYKPGALLTSKQIKSDVMKDDTDGIAKTSIMPSDYCCNKWNKAPASGIYHIFYYVEADCLYKLLPKIDLTKPRRRGVCA